MWTHFWDMHSGGGSKEKWEHIYIEAPEEEAKVVFYNRFGHSPYRVSCSCCGQDYSTSSEKSLKQLTAYQRGCAFGKKQYVERPSGDSWRKYMTLEKYKKKRDVLIIPANKIKPEERQGEVPEEGYVWV